jgi:hypothetical protein
VDAGAIAAVRAAIADALAEGHAVSLDLDHHTTVRRSALGDLLEIAARVPPHRAAA